MFSSPFDSRCSFVLLSDEAGLEYVLAPEEAAILKPGVAGRRVRGFTLGRAAAALSLKGLAAAVDGKPAATGQGVLRLLQPVLQGLQREPVWPEGVVGSISHTTGWAIAVTALRTDVTSLGIDLERIAGRQGIDISRRVCRPSELEWLAALSEAEQQLYQLVIFSAKESVYKALYPLCKRVFGFHDLELQLDRVDKKFKGRLIVDLSPQLRTGFVVSGGWSVAGQYLLSHVMV